MDSGEQVDGTNIPDTPKKSRRAKSQLDFIDCTYVYPKYFMLLSMLKFVTYL